MAIKVDENVLRLLRARELPQDYQGYATVFIAPFYHVGSILDHMTLAINNATFHAARIGHGHPLLLLHGWPEFWLTWEPVMLRLAEHYDLIAPDLRGFGDSDKPEGPLVRTIMPVTCWSF